MDGSKRALRMSLKRMGLLRLVRPLEGSSRRLQRRESCQRCTREPRAVSEDYTYVRLTRTTSSASVNHPAPRMPPLVAVGVEGSQKAMKMPTHAVIEPSTMKSQNQPVCPRMPLQSDSSAPSLPVTPS